MRIGLANVEAGEREVSSPWTAACLTAAAFALGVTLQISDGTLHPLAIIGLTIAVACCWAALVPPKRHWIATAERLGPKLAAVALFAQLAMHLAYRPQPTWHGGHATWPYYALLLLTTGAAGAMVAKRKLERAGFVVALVAFAGLGAWLLCAGPKPRMDVWVAQTAGLEAATHGRDPWSASFPDVYGKPDMYAPGTVRDGRAYLGFPYPPVTFCFDLPGYVLTGDYRWSDLAAMLGTAAFIAAAWPGRAGRTAALLFLFTPRALLVLRNGWTEPTVALLLAATAWSAVRRPRWTPWVFGLLLASKQFTFVAVGVGVLLVPQGAAWREGVKWFAKAALAAAIVTLPLAMWNLPAYLHSNFAAASGARFRYDALSCFAFWARTHDWSPPAWIGVVSLVVAAPVSVIAVRRAARSPAGFAAACGLVFVVFFALNKFAFCNYYYLVVAMLCTGAGAAARATEAAPSVEADDGALRRAA